MYLDTIFLKDVKRNCQHWLYGINYADHSDPKDSSWNTNEEVWEEAVISYRLPLLICLCGSCPLPEALLGNSLLLLFTGPVSAAPQNECVTLTMQANVAVSDNRYQKQMALTRALLLRLFCRNLLCRAAARHSFQVHVIKWLLATSFMLFPVINDVAFSSFELWCAKKSRSNIDIL